MKSIQQQRSRPEYKRQIRHRPKMGVIFLRLFIRVHSMLENGQKRYFECCQVGKNTCTLFVEVGYHWSAPIGAYIDKRRRV